VLDADLAAAFDRIDHDHLLSMLGSFPDRDLIRAWLKARARRKVVFCWSWAGFEVWPQAEDGE
jgi:retron-type reverse transcriptase